MYRIKQHIAGIREMQKTCLVAKDEDKKKCKVALDEGEHKKLRNKHSNKKLRTKSK